RLPEPLPRCTEAEACRPAVLCFFAGCLLSRLAQAPIQGLASICQPLFNSERSLRQEVCDAAAGLTVAVEFVVAVAAVAAVTLNRVADRNPVIADVENVSSTLAARLTRSDVHHRHSEKRTLTNPHARVPYQTSTVVNQSQKVRGRHVLKEMNIGRVFPLTKCSNAV